MLLLEALAEPPDSDSRERLSLIKHIMQSFNELSLNPDIIENLHKLGYERPTDIQNKAIPLLLKGHDLLGLAQTGTGKTAAFSLPLIQHLVSRPRDPLKGQPRALILSPTRELCSQIHSSVEAYSKNMKITSCAVYGGVERDEQIKKLRSGVEILVATPGRLLDLITHKQVNLSKVEIFVLDEADRMLDMGFSEEIDELIKLLPSERQSMLFSATMPQYIASLAERILMSPLKVEVTPQSSVSEKIDQKLIYCKKESKFQLLKKIIKEQDIELALVFTRTKTSADFVVEYLAQNRIASRALHGDRSQEERERALDHFKSGVIKVLVATDIASRGIDIAGVSHVINFELPQIPENYIHRIGRTARAGKPGVAISFCDSSERDYLEKVQELIKFYLPSEKFEGKAEVLKFRSGLASHKKAPTPGKSQEKNAFLDHSKRQRLPEEGKKKMTHPGFKKAKKRRK